MDCPDQYPNRGPKRILPHKEGPDHTISPSIRRDPPAPLPYYGVCSFCGSAGHGHELCPKLKEAVREQAEQIARIQIARYEEARNRVQEPSSQTKKMINYIQDKAKIAKEDCQDCTRLPEYSTGGDGGGSGLTEMMKGIPPIKMGIAVQNRGVMDFLSGGEGVEEDCPRMQTQKMMMGHVGVSRGDEGPGVTQDPGDQ